MNREPDHEDQTEAGIRFDTSEAEPRWAARSRPGTASAATTRGYPFTERPLPSREDGTLTHHAVDSPPGEAPTEALRPLAPPRQLPAAATAVAGRRGRRPARRERRPRQPRPSFRGPKLADRIGWWRRLRSVVELVVIMVIIGVILAAILAVAVGAVVVSIQHALKG